jgi:hypothetical protein
MAGEEHDARGNIHFRASRSPDLRVVREQLRRPLSAFVYIVDDDKAAPESLGDRANSISGYHCNDKMATSLQTAEDEEIVNSKPLARISPSDSGSISLAGAIPTLNPHAIPLPQGGPIPMAAREGAKRSITG